MFASALTSGCGARLAPTPATPEPLLSHTRAIRSVFLIVMENHNWSSIAGNRNAPFVNRLLKSGAHARRYYNPRGLHPSLPNYLWLEAGSNLGVTSDCLPSSCGRLHGRHLVTLLDRVGVRWRAYEESAPGPCPISPAYPYAPRHDPFVYFRDVTSRRAYCRLHVVPLSRLAADLRRTAGPRFSYITPSLCHDMHDSCDPTNNAIAQGDRWLSHEVPRIQASPAYRRGGAIIITWDEGEGGDGPIGLIVLSPDVKRPGYSNRIVYSSSSTLRTLEEIFRVRPFLGGARRAADLRALFRRFP